MIFTQGRGFVVGASYGVQIHSLRCRVLVASAACTASLATRVLIGKLIGVATLFDIGEKRCRKTFRCVPLNFRIVYIASNDSDDLQEAFGLAKENHVTANVCGANFIAEFRT